MVFPEPVVCQIYPDLPSFDNTNITELYYQKLFFEKVDELHKEFIVINQDYSKRLDEQIILMFKQITESKNVILQSAKIDINIFELIQKNSPFFITIFPHRYLNKKDEISKQIFPIIHEYSNEFDMNNIIDDKNVFLVANYLGETKGYRTIHVVKENDILDLVSKSKIIARHFHIPLQSGSDKILKLMNRKYDLDYFVNRINKIRNIDKDISITTDLIVGFPSEDDNDFNDTINTLNIIKFTKIHTFPYSKRDHTKASVMSNQVDGNIKKKRVSMVLELSNSYEYQYYNKYIDMVMDGVSELKDDGTSVVHTSNFIPVIIEDKIDNNSIVKVKINKVEAGNKVYGNIVKD